VNLNTRWRTIAGIAIVIRVIIFADRFTRFRVVNPQSRIILKIAKIKILTDSVIKGAPIFFLVSLTLIVYNEVGTNNKLNADIETAKAQIIFSIVIVLYNI